MCEGLEATHAPADSGGFPQTTALFAPTNVIEIEIS